jgi:murein DD-endopeptidase MepM/ murein hydrolase activator NlpD
MSRRSRVLVLAIGLVGSLGPAPGGAAGDAPLPREGAVHAVPLYGELLRTWDAPEDDPYAPGHRGIDIGAPTGSPVFCSADGFVVFAGTVAANGTVSVDHPDGVRTSYSYLGSIAVKKGQSVRRGDVLGSVGDGHPDANLPPHVHLSARRDGVYFDPIELYVGSGYSDLVELVG